MIKNRRKNNNLILKLLILQIAVVFASCFIITSTKSNDLARKNHNNLRLSLGNCDGKSILHHDEVDDNDSRRKFFQKATTQLVAVQSLSLFSAEQAHALTASKMGTKQKKSTTMIKPTKNFPRIHPGLKVGDTSSGIICEIFVDFTCPYSKKMFTALSSEKIETYYKNNKMAFIYHNVIQPWHHQSLWLHESSFVVRTLYPECEMAYWTALFKEASQFYDKEIYDLKRGEFYDKIASFAANIVVLTKYNDAQNDNISSNDELDVITVKEKILQYLIPPLQDGGSFPQEATILFGSNADDDENAIFPFTRQIVKYQRKRGVHVTPTVFFNGIEQTQISSSWTPDDWVEFLDNAS